MTQEQTPALKACPLADELERMHNAARGCEFDLVPQDGPIAQLALFMHKNGDKLIAALRTPDSAVAGLVEALEAYLSDCTNEECEYCIRARQALATWSAQ